MTITVKIFTNDPIDLATIPSIETAIEAGLDNKFQIVEFIFALCSQDSSHYYRSVLHR